MNAIMTAVALDDALTLCQRQILRAAGQSSHLQATPRGVQAVDKAGHLLLPAYPRRTVNALVRNGYLVEAPKGWALTSDGRRAGGDR